MTKIINKLFFNFVFYNNVYKIFDFFRFLAKFTFTLNAARFQPEIIADAFNVF